MSFVNIHGHPINWADLRERQWEHAKRLRSQGVASGRKPTVKNGYAAPPGTGPHLKQCADCKHKHSFGQGGGKHYIKCELRRATWTNGEGTDILARSPACNKFEPS